MEAPAGPVVATDPASADADYDNGAASRDMRGSRRSYDLAVKRGVEAPEEERATSVQLPFAMIRLWSTDSN